MAFQIHRPSFLQDFHIPNILHKNKKGNAPQATQAETASAATQPNSPSVASMRASRGNDRIQSLQGTFPVAQSKKVFTKGQGPEEAFSGLMETFRGFSSSDELMQKRWERFEAGEKTLFMEMTGFTNQDPNKPLTKKLRNSLIQMQKEVAHFNEYDAFDAEFCPILADSHAEHNKVPANSIPVSQGGHNDEGHIPYYKKVSAYLEGKGILPDRRPMLSSILEKLNLTHHDLMAAGKRIVHLPGEELREGVDPNEAIFMTEPEMKEYDTQAWSMISRYPTVPENRKILEMTPGISYPWVPENDKILKETPRTPEQNSAIRAKSTDYIYVRVGEGKLLLPRLEEVVGLNVIPVHIADKGSEKIGVTGLFVYSKDYRNKNSHDIPWKPDPAPELTQEKPKQKQMSSGKYTPNAGAALQEVMKRMHIGSGKKNIIAKNERAVVGDSVNALSKQGWNGMDLVRAGSDTLEIHRLVTPMPEFPTPGESAILTKKRQEIKTAVTQKVFGELRSKGIDVNDLGIVGNPKDKVTVDLAKFKIKQAVKKEMEKIEKDFKEKAERQPIDPEKVLLERELDIYKKLPPV